MTSTWLVVMLLSALLLALLLVLVHASAFSKKEGFDDARPLANELTTKGKLYADPTLCTVVGADGSPYSFRSEGLAAHPTSSAEDPKCIVVRDGMGLLMSADPTAGCVPVKDQPELHWINPLSQVGNGGAIASLYADHIAGLDRCTLSLDPSASSADYGVVDAALMLAGADRRSTLPLVLNQLETTTASLNAAIQELNAAAAQMDADATQMSADATAIGACQAEVETGEEALETLEQSSAAALQAAYNDFTAQLDAANAAAKTALQNRAQADKAACQVQLTQLQTQLDTAKTAAAAVSKVQSKAPSGPPSSLTIHVDDTDSDGINPGGTSNTGPSVSFVGPGVFAIDTGNTDAIGAFQKCKSFQVDGQASLTVTAVNQGAWFGKDVVSYGPTSQSFKSFSDHAFTFSYTSAAPAQVQVQAQTPAPQAQGPQLPSGSYQQTCKNCRYDGTSLTCDCADNNGNYVNSTMGPMGLSYCSGRIENSNGMLGCE